MNDIKSINDFNCMLLHGMTQAEYIEKLQKDLEKQKMIVDYYKKHHNKEFNWLMLTKWSGIK